MIGNATWFIYKLLTVCLCLNNHFNDLNYSTKKFTPLNFEELFNRGGQLNDHNEPNEPNELNELNLTKKGTIWNQVA